MSRFSDHSDTSGAITASAMTLDRPHDDPAVLAVVSGERPVGFRIIRQEVDCRPPIVVVRVCVYGDTALLAHLLSLLDGFGLAIADIRSWVAENGQKSQILVRDFLLDHRAGSWIRNDTQEAELREALAAAWYGEDEVDGFSRLIAAIGIRRRDSIMLRTYARYLHQIGYPVGQAQIADCLADNGVQARALVDYFLLRFDPHRAEERKASLSAAEQTLEQCAGDAATQNDVRVLLRMTALMRATLRVTFFQHEEGGGHKPYLALKLSSASIKDLPLPRPMFEIFVSGVRMEGIHLRGGKVARGGLRWSDRYQDFRTEILGLLKAQMVKNVVIVPEGSKGGFVVRRQGQLEPGEVREEAIACYKLFINALLDLTDNVVNGSVVPPGDLVRYDGDDPYLVVAADKGTATFSDIANEIAVRRGFWLQDAFASGGSAGYDHKAMGITARGAWESVRLHFSELGIDVRSNTVSVIGVGDMSGDVFGNGMLLSPNIRLVAAFDHRHIFVDPDPDPTASFAERRRLFELPGSTWMDYGRELISQGGGVFARSARSVTVSEVVRDRFGLVSCKTEPDVLIQAILRADVDLLWLGGIGTYIKASGESQERVGDRANDLVRVSARELRCRVIGEGANLGITQAGRIEFALAGGRINTDAIDNAGGVNCSDHEVNIKILLNRVEAAGRISREQRNALLSEMTDEVGHLVLRDNRMQALALSLAVARAPQTLERHVRLIRRFEREGQLNRSVAGLPDEDALFERGVRGMGLCRPELAVLLAHTKISLYAELIKSDLPDDPLFEGDLIRYFPSAMRQRFYEDILAHPLRREIVVTTVVNSMVNRMGSGFVNEMQDRTGAPDAEVARAYSVARDLSGANETWDAVAARIGLADTTRGIDLLVRMRDVIEGMAYWVLRNVNWPIRVSETVQRFMPAVVRVRKLALEQGQTGEGRTDGPADERACTSAQPAQLALMVMALDVGWIVEQTNRNLEEVCEAMLCADARLGVTALLHCLAEIRGQDALEWQVLAGAREEVQASFRYLLVSALDRHAAASPGGWLELDPRIHRFATTVSAFLDQEEPSVMSAVACSQKLRAIAA